MAKKEDSNSASLLGFARAVVGKWFTLMSGPLSVPAAIAAFWVENQTGKILLAVTAFVCVWAAAYQLWKTERKRVLELEAKFDNKKRLIPIADQLKIGQRLQLKKISQ